MLHDRANFSIRAMRPPWYYLLEEIVILRGNIWNFSVDGVQSCGPCGCAGHPWPEPCMTSVASACRYMEGHGVPYLRAGAVMVALC